MLSGKSAVVSNGKRGKEGDKKRVSENDQQENRVTENVILLSKCSIKCQDSILKMACIISNYAYITRKCILKCDYVQHKCCSS